jgi:pumilio RNA-binding family
MVNSLSFDKYGCRLVQKAVETAERDVALSLASELQGCIREASRNPHANFVIQRLIEVLPASSTRFITEELQVCAMEVAQHRTGCRVFCRIIEHTQTEGTTKELLDVVAKDSVTLSRHVFGHYVIQSLLEHGTDELRAMVAAAFKGSFFQEAQGRSSKYVVESALQFCSPEDKRGILFELGNDPEFFLKLAEDDSGYYVVRSIVKSFGHHAEVREAVAKLQTSVTGRRMLDDAKTMDW